MIETIPESVDRARRRARKGPGRSPDPSPTRVAPLLVRVEEVGELLQIGRTHIWELIWAGELPVVRLGRSVRIPRQRLEDWVQERTQTRPLTSARVDGTDVDRSFRDA